MIDPEEQLRRARACIAELGYGPECVISAKDGGGILYLYGPIPPAVVWQASFLVTGPESSCWLCYSEAWETHNFRIRADCRASNCHHPEGPKRPPRELIVTREQWEKQRAV